MIHHFRNTRSKSNCNNKFSVKFRKFRNLKSPENLTSDKIIACSNTFNRYIKAYEFIKNFIGTVSHTVNNNRQTAFFDFFPGRLIFTHKIKHFITEADAIAIRRNLSVVASIDTHARKDGAYRIRSLYFDDLSADAFYDKVSGVDNRTKYRIRCYNYSNSIFKLEKNEKKGHLTRKTAQKLTLSQVQAIRENPRLPCAEGLAEELRLFCSSRGGRPMVLVDYDRTPFICADGNTRITIDENLRTLPYRGDLFASSDAMIPVMEAEQVILEVKFDDFLPGYLNDCLADIPKAAMAISKFAMCMNLL